jgi:hypothetical protein
VTGAYALLARELQLLWYAASREYFRWTKGIYSGEEMIEAKSRLVRQMKRMKSGIQAVLVVVLSGTLALSAVACPVWMGSFSQTDIPCSEQDGAGDGDKDCPPVICLANSSYLAPESDTNIPDSQQIADELSGTNGVALNARSAERIHSDAEPPPGQGRPLFLRTHSLLI